VSNIGGSLTPLGDPPLFLGFIKGVDFFWIAQAMFAPMVILSVCLLALFYLIDRLAWRHEAAKLKQQSKSLRQIRIDGLHNVMFLGIVVAAVLASGLWDPEIDVPVGLGLSMPLRDLALDGVLLVVSYLSWKMTRPSIRVENTLTWLPIQEVAMLFAAIFITIVPALTILRAGPQGALAPLLALVSAPDGTPIEAAYFWMTGLFSSFLDNAPTYLVFFNLAGGDAQHLMGPLAGTLLAISAGAVFMGAMTYIGNAPNFMVRSICEERGIKMPSFFGYMLWSGAILLPLFAVLTLIFFI
jgi:Na+/H+ antiporter NhaD/arsenite permease-like protein